MCSRVVPLSTCACYMSSRVVPLYVRVTCVLEFVLHVF